MTSTGNDVYRLLPEGSPLDTPWGWAVVTLVAAGILVAAVAPLVSGLLTLAERKVAGHIQARYGPNRIFGHGFFQWLADGIKLILKEDLIPAEADRILFRIAPYLVMMSTALVLVVLPFGPQLAAVDMNLGVFYVFAAGSVAVAGVVMSGWASNNKWSLLGGMRAAAQIVSYELPNALAVVTVVVITGSLSLQQIVIDQGGGLGILGWNLFRSPFLFACFLIHLISGLAELNRTPFDLPEAESELVSGYNTEYSGIRFAIFFLSEFANIFVIAVLSAVFFLGGWQGPFLSSIDSLLLSNLLGATYLMGKVTILIVLILQLRWTLPRLRVDQLMVMSWKYLLPISLVCLIATAFQVTLPVPAQKWIHLAWLPVAIWVAFNLISARRRSVPPSIPAPAGGAPGGAS